MKATITATFLAGLMGLSCPVRADSIGPPDGFFIIDETPLIDVYFDEETSIDLGGDYGLEGADIKFSTYQDSKGKISGYAYVKVYLVEGPTAELFGPVTGSVSGVADMQKVKLKARFKGNAESMDGFVPVKGSVSLSGGLLPNHEEVAATVIVKMSVKGFGSVSEKMEDIAIPGIDILNALEQRFSLVTIKDTYRENQNKGGGTAKAEGILNLSPGWHDGAFFEWSWWSELIGTASDKYSWSGDKEKESASAKFKGVGYDSGYTAKYTYKYSDDGNTVQESQSSFFKIDGQTLNLTMDDAEFVNYN